jgi:menaquinone-9 beta-reductase
MTHAHLVVGGGPAGAGVAIHLAHAGREVLLLERESKPIDKVCGEFLSAEACDYLEAIDVNLERLGAVAIERVRLVGRRDTVDAQLPFRARSLSRLVLDEALLQSATRAGAVETLPVRRPPGQ